MYRGHLGLMSDSIARLSAMPRFRSEGVSDPGYGSSKLAALSRNRSEGVTDPGYGSSMLTTKLRYGSSKLSVDSGYGGSKLTIDSRHEGSTLSIDLEHESPSAAPSIHSALSSAQQYQKMRTRPLDEGKLCSS